MEARKILRRTEPEEMDYLRFILEACGSSCQFGFIKEKEGRRYHLERANCNVLVAMPLGSGKTTNLVKLEGSHVIKDLTFPGIVGTINPLKGEFIPGATIASAGKVLILDEFNRAPNSVKEALNDLLEQRPHPRSIGYSVNKNINKGGGKNSFYKIRVKKNYIHVKSRFSCIASTMFLYIKEARKKHPTDIALFTRFLPFRFIPSMEYYENLSQGKVLFEINVKPKRVDLFTFPNYMKATKLYWETFKKSPQSKFFLKDSNAFDRGATVRFLQDMVRLSAFVATLKRRTEIELDDFRAILKFFPSIASNYISPNLSEKHQAVLEMLPLPQTRIAEKIGVSRQRVGQLVSDLRRKGLVSEHMEDETA